PCSKRIGTVTVGRIWDGVMPTVTSAGQALRRITRVSCAIAMLRHGCSSIASDDMSARRCLWGSVQADLRVSATRVSVAMTRISFRYHSICTRLLGVVILLGLPGITAAAGISVASTCNPVAQKACALPFPSDLFRNLGGTYNYSDNILDRDVNGVTRQYLTIKSQYPESFRPSRIINDSDGFSALGPVLFELPTFPAHEIPADGEGHLLVIDKIGRAHV